MTTFKKRIAVLAMALLLALTAYAPLAQTLARADGEEPDPWQSVDLYLYSDNATNLAYYSNAIGAELDDSFTLYSNYISDFDGTMRDFARNDTLSNIYDSLLIFEMTDLFGEPKVNENDPEADNRILPDILYDIFGQLKDNGCRIMFINNTDETRLGGHTGFLDYVDIHVNTDFLTPYLFSAIYKIKEERGFEDSLLVLDESIAQYRETFFVPCLRTLFGYAANTGYDVFVHKNINLIYKNGANYFDVTTNIAMTVTDILNSDTISHDNISAFTSTANPACQLFLNEMNSWQSLFYQFPVFVLIDKNAIPGTALCNEIYAAGLADSLLRPLKWEIMKDFILGNDLSVYNNWEGACSVSYKPFENDPNGWIRFGYGDSCDFFGIPINLEIDYNFWSIY